MPVVLQIVLQMLLATQPALPQRNLAGIVAFAHAGDIALHRWVSCLLGDCQNLIP